MNKRTQEIIERYLTRRNLSEYHRNRYHDSNPVFQTIAEKIPQITECWVRLTTAIANQDHIHVYGDYDCDGMTSTAIMVDFLQQTLRKKPTWDVPDRQTDDYGLGIETADRIINKGGTKLVLALDCGTNSNQAISRLKAAGIDTIVVDHHPVTEDVALDTVAMINPKFHKMEPEIANDLQELCTGGLIYLLCKDLAARWQISWNDDAALLLAGIATLGDSCKLQGTNRALVKASIRRMNLPNGLACLPGLDALCVRETEGITQHRLQFHVIPKLNALGRIASAAHGVELLLCKNHDRAHELAAECLATNETRQQKQATMIEVGCQLANKIIEKNPDTQLLILHHEDWHHGIAGPTASKISEKFKRSTIILAPQSPGKWKGSGRSFNNDDLGSVITQLKKEGLLASGGGHAGAVGVTARPEQLPGLTTRAVSIVPPQIHEPEPLEEVIGDWNELDVEEWMDVMKTIEPFGRGNPQPLLYIKNAILTEPITPLRTRATQEIWAQRGLFKTPEGTVLKIAWADIDAAAEKWRMENKVNLTVELTWRPFRGKLYFNWNCVETTAQNE